ncbi:polyamine aminopropyltransferase 1 [Lysobacter helvus]|uniref:Polyamine aminopropyltransferase n=2 Tax=Lysobacteraceae TaxID=32033 RepID=A0ABN6FRK4_9GAMM|nr:MULTISPECIES: polyamine aminopropyltransferase [Lysobacter]BCT91960.1 polyamine aminopropyltransferase 1 [Lysobacter caseinilyticus]BCT95113.1 polyamine aminopropyltransferase 1 [Lysobacter helvus]
MRDRALILSVLIVASCGLGYELISSALASYLLGDSILQFSSVIGCYLFAMGIGSWASRYVEDDDVLDRFVDLEMLIGLLGGASAAILFIIFAWLSTPFRTSLYVMVFLLGLMVGMEIPLVMRIFNRRRTEFRELVSRVLAFDYLGALVVSLVFPLVLAPYLGLLRTAFLFGLSNTCVAMWTALAFRDELTQPRRQMMRGVLVLGLLCTGLAFSGRMTQWAERGIYGDEIVHAQSTPFQRLVVTRWQDDLRLYINGNLQFSSRDEYRYHEALVHPGLQALPGVRRVLVLGGGDGLAVREILKVKSVEHVTLVDLDPAMTGMFSTSPALVALNRGSLKNPRVTVVNNDAGRWLEANRDMFDFIVVDFPDPSNFGIGRLYSVPMFRLMARHLSANGYMVVQSTSPYFAPRSFWSIDATLREANLHTWAYHCDVPSFGDWGFILAGHRRDYTVPRTLSVPTRYLTTETMRELFVFPKDMQRLAMPPNRLDEQTLVRYFDEDWRRVIR